MFGPAWLAYGHSFALENEHDQAMAAYFKVSFYIICNSSLFFLKYSWFPPYFIIIEEKISQLLYFVWKQDSVMYTAGRRGCIIYTGYFHDKSFPLPMFKKKFSRSWIFFAKLRKLNDFRGLIINFVENRNRSAKRLGFWCLIFQFSPNLSTRSSQTKHFTKCPSLYIYI